MNPYREALISAGGLSFKDKLYLSGTPGRRVMFYAISCVESIAKLIAYISLCAFIMFLISSILYGAYTMLSETISTHPYGSKVFAVVGIAVLFLVLVTSIAVDDYKYKLKKKLNEPKHFTE